MGAGPSAQSVYCVSDIHTDHKENWSIIMKLADQKHIFQHATLICAGDVSTDLEVLQETLTFLRSVFAHGNNELRLSKHDAKHFASSIEKFHAVLKLCKDLGVHVMPQKVSGVWIVPLFSWYTPYFDPKYNGDASYKRDEDRGAAQYMLAQNKDALAATYDAPVITYSHFLPRMDCLPSITSSFMKASLPLVIGCPELDTQIRQVKSTIHVFGHTHLNIDKTVDGVRYVQNAFAVSFIDGAHKLVNASVMLGHPSERKGLNLQKLSESLKCIYSPEQ